MLFVVKCYLKSFPSCECCVFSKVEKEVCGFITIIGKRILKYCVYGLKSQIFNLFCSRQFNICLGSSQAHGFTHINKVISFSANCLDLGLSCFFFFLFIILFLFVFSPFENANLVIFFFARL